MPHPYCKVFRPHSSSSSLCYWRKETVAWRSKNWNWISKSLGRSIDIPLEQMLTTSGDWRTPMCWHARMSNQARQKNAGRACFVNFAAVPQPPNRSRFNLKPCKWLHSFAIFPAFPCDLCGFKTFLPKASRSIRKDRRSLSTSQDFATRLSLWRGHSCLRLGWREDRILV